MSAASSRRALLSALAVAPIAASVAGARALAFVSNSRTDDRWWRLHARWERLRAATDHYRSTVEDAAWEAKEAGLAKVGHHTVTTPMGQLTTENWRHVNEARIFLIGHNAERPFTEFESLCREIVAHDEKRSREAKRLATLHRVHETAERGERMHTVCVTLETRLLHMPAPDLASALWKFDYIIGWNEGPDCDTPAWSKGHIGTAIADVRRFLGGEA